VADVKTYVSNIRKAIYGMDVRESIAAAVEKIDEVAEGQKNSAAAYAKQAQEASVQAQQASQQAIEASKQILEVKQKVEEISRKVHIHENKELLDKIDEPIGADFINALS